MGVIRTSLYVPPTGSPLLGVHFVLRQGTSGVVLLKVVSKVHQTDERKDKSSLTLLPTTVPRTTFSCPLIYEEYIR